MRAANGEPRMGEGILKSYKLRVVGFNPIVVILTEGGRSHLNPIVVTVTEGGRTRLKPIVSY